MVSDRRVLQSVIISNLVLNFGFQIWGVVFNNLAVGDLGLEAGAVGAIHSIREIPGLMGFLFVFLVSLLGSEMRVMGASVVLLGVGVALTGLAQDVLSLIFGTLVTSIGFHYYISGSPAVLMQVTDSDETPKALGRLSSLGAFGAVLATVVVFVAALVLNNRHIMIVGGAIVVVVGLALLPRMNVGRRVEHKGKRARESVRREYWLYYVLTFLMATRRHIFTTFAIFLLVRVHGLETSQTALLFLINGLVSFVALPQFGRLVARFGERRMLTVNFVGLVGIFMGYATIDSVMVLIPLFVVDNLFFGFSLAINSYFRRIAVVPEDITPNVSLGLSIGHVAAVIIPVLGGWMWETFDPATPFLGGAVIALISLVLMQWMRVPRREPAWSSAG